MYKNIYKIGRLQRKGYTMNQTFNNHISNNHIEVKQDNKLIYEIILEKDYEALHEVLEQLETRNKKVCIVTDSGVEPLYLKTLCEVVKPYVKKVEYFVFPAGEDSKNLSVVNNLYEELIGWHFDRKDILIALGGGVVGDLTGFAAATYLRGIQFIQMPTSLLAMVDSSIGGKTGVDFKNYKNMVGAFHQPSCVYMNLRTLLTLDDKQFYSGFGEIIKHGLIKNKSYYNWLKDNSEKLVARDINKLAEMVYESCLIKKEVVENDPKEKGERALLNFGHTIGHAIEKLMNFKLLHGECVAIGMVAASFISWKRNYITNAEYEDIKKTIQAFHLPIFVHGLTVDEVLSAMAHDKKVEGNIIKFILLDHIGEAKIDTTLTREELVEAIETVLV